MKYIRAICGLCLFLATSGCYEDEVKPKDVSFRNASSYNVTVFPGSDEKFQPFTLRPGGKYLVLKEDINGDINWSYLPRNRVYVSYKDGADVTFRTR